VDVAGREHRIGLILPVNSFQPLLDFPLAFGLSLPYCLVHSKSLSVVGGLSSTTIPLTAKTRGFRAFFALVAEKVTLLTLG
jgi:hypothetical protein